MDLFFIVPSQSRFQQNHLTRHLRILGHHLKTDFHSTGPSTTMSSYSLQNVKSTKALTYDLPQSSRTSPMAMYPETQLASSTTPLTLYRLVTLNGKHTNSHTMDLNLMGLCLNGWSRSMSSTHMMYWPWLSNSLRHQSLMTALITPLIKNLGLMVSMCGQISCLATGNGKKQYIFSMHFYQLWKVGCLLPWKYITQLIPHLASKPQRKKPAFQKFCCQLYHKCLKVIFSSLKAYMNTPKIVRCPDRHFCCAIFSLRPYIADYPEQVWLSGIVSNWCPK